MTTPGRGIELPAAASNALVQLAELLQSHPDDVLADALDCLESAHGVGPRNHGRPMPRRIGGYSSWTNLERSLEDLERHQADLDHAFAMHKRACKAKMRYARHEGPWNALLKGVFAVLHADESRKATPTTHGASPSHRQVRRGLD